MQDWRIFAKKADFDRLGRENSISPLTARIMINRGVPEDGFRNYLYGDISGLRDPHMLEDIDEASFAVLNAIDEGQRIRVVGDYDIDGVCSAYILLDALKKLGAEADYRIPDRVRDGYGINRAIIEEAHKDGIDMILTCDNGIAAAEEMNLAAELGITVVITDHHEVPKDENGNDILPEAECVVDPKRSSDGYPFKEICGAMVAFKLVQVLFENAGMDVKEAEQYIPFAAMATVGDVMPLQDENRILVREGLKRIAHTENIGLRTLVELCGLDIRALTAFHIGFVLGPCLNAGGRLENADVAMSLFVGQDVNEAHSLAQHLKDLNDERKALTEQYTDKACEIVESMYPDDAVKVVYLPGCHESVAGIIAGRLKERYNHPAIVLADSDVFVKGSGRSIEPYHMFEKLSEVRQYMERFGGHKLAAGMSLKKENVDAFRKFLNENSGLSEKDFIEKVWIDIPLPFAYCTEKLTEELKLLEPFGQGNTKPVFAQRDVSIIGAAAVGRNRNAVKLRLKDSTGSICDGIIFTDADKWLKGVALNDRIDILYYPQVNEYQGRKTLQLVIKGWRKAPDRR